jgi:hypothetical protein
MATLYDYRAFGLNIASEFDIPGGVRFDLPVSNADIIIRSGDTSIGEAEATNGPYTRIGQALLFDAPGIARYYAPSPRQLYIEAYHGGDARQIGELLIATALPMLLWMRGGIVLHAAGIVPAGMDWAIAIAGPSGIGKSTLAAGLIETGAKLVGDDSLWLTLRGNKPVVSGLSVTLFKSGNSASPRTEIEIPAQSRIEGARLAAIIALRIASENTRPTTNRLHGVDAFEALLQNRHRPKIPAILGLGTKLLPLCMLHCRTLPIYKLSIPNGEVARSQQHVASMISDNFGSV